MAGGGVQHGARRRPPTGEEGLGVLAFIFGTLGFMVVSTVAGVLVAALVVPVVGGAGYGAQEAVRRFEELPTSLPDQALPQRSVLLAADGSRLAVFYEQNRLVVPLDKIAPVMRRAIVAVEDRRFYQHGPVDLKAVVRALVENTQSGAVQQGASSLTQQYVKNVLVQAAGADRRKVAEATAPTLVRKLRELRYAIALEDRLSKNAILERYLNIAYFGDGAYGVETAARHFFRTSAEKLTLPQAALLAGLVRRPSAYAPSEHSKALLSRRNLVLDRMVEAGMISAPAAMRAKRARLGLRLTPASNGCAASKAPFFCDYALAVILSDPAFGQTRQERRDLLLRGGVVIRTTLDPKVQRAAQRAIDGRIERRNRVATALAVVEPGTGEVKALASNRRYGAGWRQTKVNLAVDKAAGGSSGFQAGSTFKPFVLAAAVEQGIPVTRKLDAPASVTVDGFRNCGSGARYAPYKVENYDGKAQHEIDMRQATWRSVNTYYVQLERLTGQCRPAQIAERMGLHRADGRPLEAVPSFVLGTQEVSPLAMAETFATFAAHGVHCRARVISRVRTLAGATRPVQPPRCTRVLPIRVADTVTSVLTGVIDGPDPHRTGARMSLGRPAAGKTGTTSNDVSVWFVGYTPRLAAAVWAGYPDRSKPLRNVVIKGQRYDRLFGSRLPGPIWRDVMSSALRGTPPAAFVR